MQPAKSIVIVLVAFMLTGMCGFLLQPAHEVQSATHYGYEGDMTPSVTYSVIDDWTEYNPLTNVTGWTGTDIIQPISDVATPYLKEPRVLSYHFSSTITNIRLTAHKLQLNQVSGLGDILQTNGVILSVDPYNSTLTNFAYDSGEKVLGKSLVWDKTQNTFTVITRIGGVWTPSEDPKYQNIPYDNNLLLYSYGASSTPTTSMDVYIPVLSDPVYLDSTLFNEIPVGSTATWNNGQINGIVRVLCSPNTIISVINPAYTFSCDDTVGYEYVLWTLDCLNQRFTYQGVTSLTNTLAYTIDDHEYPLTVTGTGTLNNITTLAAGTDSETEPCEIYIDSTVVSVDPSGLLWGNPIMNGWYYYPDSFGQHDMRILFNGFVKYGNTITVNGQSFDVVDGKLKYEYQVENIRQVEVDGEMTTITEYTTVTEYYPLKGMAVDYIYKGGYWYVSLIFTEYSNYTIDLGSKVDTTYTYNIQVGDMTKEITVPLGNIISGTGTWFWQSTMYSITQVTEDHIFLDATSGIFGLSLGGAALMMVFFVILSTAIAVRVMNVELTFVDWIILAGSIVAAICIGIS